MTTIATSAIIPQPPPTIQAPPRYTGARVPCPKCWAPTIRAGGWIRCAACGWAIQLRPRRRRVTLPRRPEENTWATLTRLGFQSVFNECWVFPEPNYRVFWVRSQSDPRPRCYRVYAVDDEWTCECTRHCYGADTPCAHIGAVYWWCMRQLPPPPPPWGVYRDPAVSV